MGKYEVYIYGLWVDQYWSVSANGSAHGVSKDIKYQGTGGYRSYDTPIIYSTGFNNADDGTEGVSKFDLEFRTYTQEDWDLLKDWIVDFGVAWNVRDDAGTEFYVWTENISWRPVGTNKQPWKHEWSMSGTGRREL